MRWSLGLQLPLLVLGLESLNSHGSIFQPSPAWHLQQTQGASQGRLAAFPSLASKNHLCQVWDTPWDVLSGVCPAQTRTCSPPQAHQQQGQFLKFGGVCFSKYHIVLVCWSGGTGSAANDKRSQENGSKEVQFQIDYIHQSQKYFAVAETRFICRRKMVKHQLKAAALSTYCN